jgi:hypothetical protein
MSTKKLNLAAMQRTLTRDDMKKLTGGLRAPGGDLCSGVVQCKKDAQVGDACFEGCTCNSGLSCVKAASV